jgi:clan AA aspartic protease (TIGR02281 family)
MACVATAPRVLAQTWWICASDGANTATGVTPVPSAIKHHLGVKPGAQRAPPESRKLMPNRWAAAFFVLLMAALPGIGMRAVRAESVPLRLERGAFVLPVVINGLITRTFMIDSGASDVTISTEVLAALAKTGTVAAADYLDSQVYQLADGSKTRTQRIRIRSLRVGGVELRDVTVSVAPHADLLLLGQSFLGRLQSWSIDNERHLFAINETPAVHPAASPVARHEAVAVPEDWLSIGQSEGGLQRLYVDRSSVRVKDGIARASFKTIFSSHTVKGVASPNKWMSSIISRYAFDCEEATVRVEEATEYYDDGTNYVVPPGRFRGTWSSVQPGSGFNNEMRVACKSAGGGGSQRQSSNP